MFDRVKIGLSLGAGGARGLAHIGVLTALEKAGIEISYIAGSSIGALVGAGYALGGNAAGLQKRVLEFVESEEYVDSGLNRMRDALSGKPETWSGRIETWMKKLYLQARFVTSTSVMDSDVFRGIIEYFIPKVNIEDLPIPFQAMGTDLRSGKAVLFKTGSLRAAVYASSAIPGLVRPLAHGDMLIVDGGVVNMVPILPLRQMGADLVIAVDVEKETEPVDEFGSAFDILFRVEEVQNAYIKKLQLANADLIIRPEVGHIHWSDFESATEMIRLGKDAAASQLDEIKALTSKRKMPWKKQEPLAPEITRGWITV